MQKNIDLLDQPTQQSICLNAAFKTLNNYKLNRHQLRLHSLSKLAQQIEFPIQFGHFKDADHYLMTLKLLYQSTNETKQRLLFYSKIALPMLRAHEHLLDIGIGTGLLTRIIGKDFPNITLVDTAPEALRKIRPYQFKKCIKLYKTACSILDFEKKEVCYDFINVSHTLYYIDPSRWPSIIEKLYNTLTSKGILVITLTGTLDKDHIIQHFNGCPLPIRTFIRERLQQDYPDTSIFHSTVTYNAMDIRTMMHIAGLHLSDSNARASHHDLESYVDKNFKQSDNTYEMKTKQFFAVISKQ